MRPLHRATVTVTVSHCACSITPTGQASEPTTTTNSDVYVLNFYLLIVVVGGGDPPTTKHRSTVFSLFYRQRIGNREQRTENMQQCPLPLKPNRKWRLVLLLCRWRAIAFIVSQSRIVDSSFGFGSIWTFAAPKTNVAALFDWRSASEANYR